MMAHGHALSGAVGYLAAAGPLGLPTDGRHMAAGVLLTAGAALAPDLDHPGSTLSRTGGLATQAISAAVNAVSGGHRQLTHSALFVAAVAIAATWLSRLGSPRPAAVVAGVLVAAAAPLLARSLPRGLAGATAAGLVPAIWIGHGIDTTALDTGPWFVAAIAGGVALHLVGDALTPGGIPILAPLTSERFGLPLFSTGGLIEGVVTTALAVAAVWLALPHLPLPT